MEGQLKHGRDSSGVVDYYSYVDVGIFNGMNGLMYYSSSKT